MQCAHGISLPVTYCLLCQGGKHALCLSKPKHIHKLTHYACLRRWDSFGRLIQSSAARVPWQVIEGNHEEEVVKDKLGFLAYNTRFHVPSVSSESHTSLYYSYQVGSGLSCTQNGEHECHRLLVRRWQAYMSSC